VKLLAAKEGVFDAEITEERRAQGEQSHSPVFSVVFAFLRDLCVQLDSRDMEN